MIEKVVNRIVLTQNNELFLTIIGQGNPSCQYVYREAAGVSWDDNEKSFKSTLIGDWTIFEWFFHIKGILINVFLMF